MPAELLFRATAAPNTGLMQHTLPCPQHSAVSPAPQPLEWMRLLTFRVPTRIPGNRALRTAHLSLTRNDCCDGRN